MSGRRFDKTSQRLQKEKTFYTCRWKFPEWVFHWDNLAETRRTIPWLAELQTQKQTNIRVHYVMNKHCWKSLEKSHHIIMSLCVSLWPDGLLVISGVLLQELDVILRELLLHATRAHNGWYSPTDWLTDWGWLWDIGDTIANSYHIWLHLPPHLPPPLVRSVPSY